VSLKVYALAAGALAILPASATHADPSSGVDAALFRPSCCECPTFAVRSVSGRTGDVGDNGGCVGGRQLLARHVDAERHVHDR
jgi:hypothetical protein